MTFLGMSRYAPGTRILAVLQVHKLT